MTYPLSLGMTPVFYDPDHMLLRAQLKCLSRQRFKDFDVWLIDPHYTKRKNLVPEWAAHYRLNLVHIPYVPNLHVAKKLDCAAFNAIYCYSQAPRIARYSCYRFVRPEWTETMMTAPVGVNMDFYSSNVGPPSNDVAHPRTDHNTLVWNFDSDEVHWDKVPDSAGQPGARWTKHSDVDVDAAIVPGNCCGNVMWWRDKWLELNGTDEVFTNTEHFEDIHFCRRAINAGQQAARKAKLLYRIHHFHGKYAGRGNEPADHEFREPCDACKKAITVQAPYRYDIKNRLDRKEITLFEEEKVWVCNTCHLSSSAWNENPSEFINHVRDRKITQASVIPKFKIGRNLRVLTADMDGASLTEKVRIYNHESWTKDRYYASAS